MESAPAVEKFTVLIVAGQRPGSDPLASHFGTDAKALVEIAGAPMLAHVVRAALAHPGATEVLILAQDPHRLTAHAGTAWIAGHPQVRLEAGGPSVSQTVADAIARHPSRFPFLLLTADNPLLDRRTLDTFVEGARASGADLAFGVVERRTMLSAYPSSRRTWLRFRGGAYSGANLFWLASPSANAALLLWRTIEQDRKRARAVIGAFGLPMLLAISLRLISLRRALAIGGRRLGLVAAAIELPFAEACIDVDKIEDHALAAAILAQRGRGP